METLMFDALPTKRKPFRVLLADDHDPTREEMVRLAVIIKARRGTPFRSYLFMVKPPVSTL